MPSGPTAIPAAAARLAGASTAMTKDRLTCEETVRQLAVYLDQELDSATSTAMARHLATCPECSSRAEFEKRLRRKLREAGTQKAPDRLYRRLKDMQCS